jgi:serine/threonine protein kinase
MSVRPPRDSNPPIQNEPVILGPYVLQEQLGGGEFASVYAGRLHQTSSRSAKVTIKLLHEHHTHNGECRHALMKEAQIASLASAPQRRITYVDNERTYLVMSPIEGASLATLLSRSRAHGTDPTRFVTTIVCEVLTELQALHDGSWSESGEPLVHRAPHARHIMVGKDGHACLIDFTSALGVSFPHTKLSDERFRPEEMAPEQALAPANVDARCDIFIMGVVLWEALTGQQLFAAPTVDAALHNLLRSAIVLPSEAGARSHRTFDRVCMGALARSRAERTSSAAELAAQLRDEATRAGLLATQDEVGRWVTSLLAQDIPAISLPRRPTMSRTLTGIGELNLAEIKIRQSQPPAAVGIPSFSVRRGAQPVPRSEPPPLPSYAPIGGGEAGFEQTWERPLPSKPTARKKRLNWRAVAGAVATLGVILVLQRLEASSDKSFESNARAQDGRADVNLNAERAAVDEVLPTAEPRAVEPEVELEPPPAALGLPVRAEAPVAAEPRQPAPPVAPQRWLGKGVAAQVSARAPAPALAGKAMRPVVPTTSARLGSAGPSVTEVPAPAPATQATPAAIVPTQSAEPRTVHVIPAAQPAREMEQLPDNPY